MIKEDFYTGSGFDGLSWWARASGISSGSINDHIDAALTKCGYTGSVNDKVTAFGRRLFGDSALSINDINRKLLEQNFYNSMTFFKDYVNASGLNADFSIGSPTATYTSTSGTPTLDADGYAATPANDDVLQYEISKNRTAAQETIVIKFMPLGANIPTNPPTRFLHDTDTKSRLIRNSSFAATLAFAPNITDSSGSSARATTTFLKDVFYVITAIAAGPSVNNNIKIFINGIDETTGTADSENGNYTSPAWGTLFYIGSDNAGANQLNGSIAWIKIFNRDLSASEVAVVSNGM